MAQLVKANRAENIPVLSGRLVNLCLVFFQCVRQLVPGLESADPAGHGQDHEGEPGAVRVARAHPEGAAAVQQRAHGAVPVLAQLRGAVLQPDHLVRGRHQRLPSHHPQDIRGQPHH